MIIENTIIEDIYDNCNLSGSRRIFKKRADMLQVRNFKNQIVSVVVTLNFFLLAIGFSYYFCTLNIIQYNLEHFRFPEVFFRQTKKAYISSVSPEIVDIANIPNYCTNNYCSNYYCEFIIFFFYHFYFCSFFFLVLLKIGEGMLLRTLLVCVSLLHLVLEVINPRCSFSATNLSLD